MSTEAPADYKQAGLFMLISGIMNMMLFLTWSCLSLYILLATLGLGFCCCCYPFIFLGVGGYEISTALKIQKGEPVAGAKNAAVVGLVGGVLGMSVISIIMEVMAMSYLGKPEVQEWLDANT
jgi:hypothetical protein